MMVVDLKTHASLVAERLFETSWYEVRSVGGDLRNGGAKALGKMLRCYPTWDRVWERRGSRS
jgi:hypothetical protein